MDKFKIFIENFNILFVEDEKSAREILSKIFRKKFNNIEVCENGVDGYFRFQKGYNTNKKFDLIISDINMPKMNGLDMLQKIRELDRDVPIIFITARNESTIIIKAIKLEVAGYIIKPLDINELNKVINKTCEKIYLKNIYEKEHRELGIYLKKIEQIALIAKLNLEGNIKYLNNNYINILGYKNYEILNKNYEILKDEQSNGNLYKDLWETIRNGKVWEGTLKNCTKNGEIIYERSTIMPVFDETNTNIIEYICINYLITDQEKQKKLLNKKIIQTIVYFKKENYLLAQEKQKFYNDTIDLKKYIFSMENEIKSFIQNRIYLLNQLEAYELNSLNQTNGKLNIIEPSEQSHIMTLF